MKNLIGGLFETQENANLAYEALQTAGFRGEEINMFVRKPRNKAERATDMKVQDLAKYAFLGGLIGATIGGAIGFLAGARSFSTSDPNQMGLVFAYAIGGVVVGGLIGVMLGVASRLLRSREKAEVMTKQIEKRGVLVTVSVDDAQAERKARRVMEGHNATEVGNPHEKWDLDLWVSPNENTPSLADIR